MKTKLFSRHHQRYAVNLHILYRSLLLLVLMLFVSYVSEAQVNADSGAVKITVKDKSNNEAIPFANVVAYQNGVQVAVGTTNMDGESLLKNLAPGKYDVKAIYVGYKASEIKGILLGSGRTTYCNLSLDGGDNLIVCYTYCCCGGYNGYVAENWWPKLWTPYREGYKAWKEKKEKKKALAAKQPKKKEIILSEAPDETETIDSTLITRVAQIESIKEEIKIYPNPSSGIVFVDSEEPLQISVLNAEGKIVKEELTSNTTTELKLNNLSTGVYYLNYTLKGKSESRKVVMINQ